MLQKTEIPNLVWNPIPTQNAVDDLSLYQKKGKLSVNFDNIVVFKYSHDIEQILNRLEKYFFGVILNFYNIAQNIDVFLNWLGKSGVRYPLNSDLFFIKIT